MRCEWLLHKAVDTTVDVVEFSQVHVRVEVSDVALYLERTAFRIYKDRNLKNGDERSLCRQLVHLKRHWERCTSLD